MLQKFPCRKRWFSSREPLTTRRQGGWCSHPIAQIGQLRGHCSKNCLQPVHIQDVTTFDQQLWALLRGTRCTPDQLWCHHSARKRCMLSFKSCSWRLRAQSKFSKGSLSFLPTMHGQILPAAVTITHGTPTTCVPTWSSTEPLMGLVEVNPIDVASKGPIIRTERLSHWPAMSRASSGSRESLWKHLIRLTDLVHSFCRSNHRLVQRRIANQVILRLCSVRPLRHCYGAPPYQQCKLIKWFQTQSRTCKTTGERIGDVSCVFLHKQCKVPRCETARALWAQITAVFRWICTETWRTDTRRHYDGGKGRTLWSKTWHSSELLNRLWNVEVFQVFDKELIPQHHVVRRGEMSFTKNPQLSLLLPCNDTSFSNACPGRTVKRLTKGLPWGKTHMSEVSVPR